MTEPADDLDTLFLILQSLNRIEKALLDIRDIQCELILGIGDLLKEFQKCLKKS